MELLQPRLAAPRQERVEGAGGYPLEVRVWDAAEPVATVVMLHGIVSHSGWLDPIASRLVARGIEVVCPDRRGSGRSTRERGDAASGAALVEDVERLIARYATDGRPLHLCGFCWGAVYAVRFLGAERPVVRSLILLAPGLYPAPALAALPLETGDSPDATLEPLVPLDGFTRGPAFREFILPDPLRLRAVSPRFNSIVADFASLMAPRLSRLRLPVLCILAESDSISDNEATRRGLELMRSERRTVITVPGEHGIQFDSPEAAAGAIADWVTSSERGSPVHS